MHRPTGLTDQNSNTIVNNVTYNAANQLLTFNNETRTYNNLNQMTRLQVTGNLDISYNFPAGTNNGKDQHPDGQPERRDGDLSVRFIEPPAVGVEQPILERNVRIRRLRQSAVEDSHGRRSNAFAGSGCSHQPHRRPDV